LEQAYQPKTNFIKDTYR